jgi:preprotein translocase subunit SecF
MVTALEAALGPIASQGSLTTIGPVVSADLVNQALVLIAVGALGILLWITYRFRDVKFGVTALVALVHDVIVVVGTFAILGTFFHVEIDALFVTAMLTVIGFSVHDTIVVFDRSARTAPATRRAVRRGRQPLDPADARPVDHDQLHGRADLLALLLFGGSAIRNFVLALLIGIISGTYSSIFNASPLLVVWQNWDDKRRGRAVSTRTPRTRRAVS